MKPASPSYSFGNFEFDPSQQELRSAAERSTLPATLNKLLLLFVTRAGVLVTRDDIAQALWDDHGTIDIENGINGAVRRLRAQLSAGQPNGGSADNYIQTIVGTGYRFIAPVTVMEPPAPRELPHPTQTEAETEDALRSTQAVADVDHPWRRRLLPAGLLFLLLCALGGAVWQRLRNAGGVVKSPVPVPSVSIAWTPETFRELDDNLTAQALAPSSTFLAWADSSGIFVQKLHASEARRLSVPEGLLVQHLSWFPDERRLLASGVRQGSGGRGERSEAWVVSLAGEAPSLLLDEAALAAVSPDGRRLAYARSGRSEVWVADADGQQTRRLVGAKAGNTFSCLLWSSRSDRLVVNRDVTDARGGTDPEKGALDQLQHQHQSAYESYDAGSGKLLARQADVHFDSGFFLNDARFFYPVHGDSVDLKLGVARTNPSTGEILAVSGLLTLPDVGMGTLGASNLTVSQDGKTISAVLERPSVDVYVGNLSRTSADAAPALGDPRRFARHIGTNYPTSWSPAGDALLFDEGDAGRSVIARKSVGDEKRSVVADTGGRAVLGQYTPDGKWILFLHYVGKPSRVQSVDRVRATGGSPETLYASPDIVDYRCSRSAAGRCVLREGKDNKELVYYALDASTGRGRELARTPWEPNVLGDWSLSPDGKTIAVANHDPVNPSFTLIRLAGAGGDKGANPAAETKIPLNGYGTVLCPTWAVNGKGFFVEVHTEASYALIYVTLDGKATVFLKSAVPVWAVESRDGKKLAFPSRTPLNRNVWSGTLR